MGRYIPQYTLCRRDQETVLWKVAGDGETAKEEDARTQRRGFNQQPSRDMCSDKNSNSA